MGPSRVYFFFISGARKGRIEAVEAEVIRIGRQHYCELQLDPYQDIPASGDHARVLREGPDRWALVDSGSTWGTWKNDVRVMGKVPLLTGDVITCGHDDRGRAGPRIRFYSDKDILRCPSCDGPVYKRHFRCPTCARKYCLRCIDFRTQTCKPCGTSPAAHPGLPPLSAPTVASTRILPVPAGADMLDGPFCNLCNEFVRVPVFTCGGCRRTYCVDHRQATGSCPVCAGAGQALEDWGRGSEPELSVPDAGLWQPPGPGPFNAGAPGGPFGPGGTFGLPGAPPGPFTPAPATSPQTVRREGPPSAHGRGPETRGMQRPVTESGRDLPAPIPTSGTGRLPVQTDTAEGELSQIEARRPPTIPCERCQAPLAMRDFFVCSMCRGRMCSRHRSQHQTELCDLCASGAVGGQPPEPPPELFSTAGDDAKARAWKKSDYVRETTADSERVPRQPPATRPPPSSGVAPPRRDLAETQTSPDGPTAQGRDVMDLSGVSFECPYCDAPITPGLRSCPKCQRDL